VARSPAVPLRVEVDATEISELHRRVVLDVLPVRSPSPSSCGGPQTAQASAVARRKEQNPWPRSRSRRELDTRSSDIRSATPLRRDRADHRDVRISDMTKSNRTSEPSNASANATMNCTRLVSAFDHAGRSGGRAPPLALLASSRYGRGRAPSSGC
jgi:hypothetical protein